jgi:hypothetical protein
MRRTGAGALVAVALMTVTACDPVQPWRHVLVDVDAPPWTILEFRMLVGSRTWDPFPESNRGSVEFGFTPP